MTKTSTLSGLLLLAATAVMAQPAVTDTTNFIPIGYGDSISVLTSAVPPGSAGANQTWDFSALTPATAGYASYVYANTTPYTASYPSATRAAKIETPAGTIYEYDIVSATKWEQLAANVTATTVDDYSVNPKTMLPIPFHYGDVVVDTFYKNAAGPYTVTMTYEGYGTLITPYATYNNVIRMKRSFGGSDYYIDFYSTSPYTDIVVSFDNNTNQYTFIGTSPLGLKKVNAARATVQLYPNPFTETTRVLINTHENMKGASLVLTDITGRKVKELPAEERELTLSRDGLQAGLYFYSVCNANGCLAQGKISIQ